ncbi:MAG: radical SAM family heme chaperone HemW [Prevotella sp.]|nr:radical SAM family heme chaperone HemW [Prevotella sp.]
MAGIYVHVPFCKSRCIYCGFFSTTQLAMRQRYVEALCREMQLQSASSSQFSHIETVYLGGGTPSQLEGEQLRSLFSCLYNIYNVSADVEVTIECNPDDVTPQLADCLAHLPVNRVSMGAQTFSDERLRWLRRRHTADQVRRAVHLLRQTGIGNISIDLMYGFPGETLPEWHADIDAALALGVEHLSAYALSIEEGTALHAMVEESRVEELADELQRQMYYDLKDRLEVRGYEHYELSNFALPGRRSRHNSSYWNHTPYIGLGAGAHSFFGTHRQWNVADVQAYINAIEAGNIPAETEQLNDDTLYNETVMTALRTREGIALDTLPLHYRHYCECQAQRYIESGWLKLDDKTSRLRLTREGLFVSDRVMADLFVPV